MRRPARGRGCEAGRLVSRSERETGRKLDRSRRVSANAIARNAQIFGRRRIIVVIDIIAVVEQVQNVDAESQARFLADEPERDIFGDRDIGSEEHTSEIKSLMRNSYA